MTETDTSREAVERDAEYWEGWAADIRANNGSVADAANMDAICARYRALLARAEKAEAERDAGLLREEDANKRAMMHLRRAEKAEIAAKNYSEFNHEWRKLADTAWNDAIEAAAKEMNPALRSMISGGDAQKAILALKKGDTP